MLHEKIKQLRQNRTLLQADVADALGIGRSAYAMYEQGRRQPDYETLKKIADYFSVTTDFLLGEKKEHKKIFNLVEMINNGKTDDEILNHFTFVIDDIELSAEEAQEFISYIRMKRALKNNK